MITVEQLVAAHEETPGRPQVSSHPLGEPGEARAGGAHKTTRRDHDVNGSTDRDAMTSKLSVVSGRFNGHVRTTQCDQCDPLMATQIPPPVATQILPP